LNRRRRVRAPASSANLGPGYDALAAALSPALELEVEETDGALAVECDVPGVPLDRSNLCVRAFEALRPAEGLTFRIRSAIPPSAGLGSSIGSSRARLASEQGTVISATVRRGGAPRPPRPGVRRPVDRPSTARQPVGDRTATGRRLRRR